MKVAVIIPALNEEKTIKSVIKPCLESELIDEIIVVSDGSTDKTVEVARDTGVKVIELKENIGKAGALITGVKNTDADILLLSLIHISEPTRPY